MKSQMFVGIGGNPLEVGTKAPDFTLPSSSGKPVSLGDFANKKLFLFFFRGTWCPTCANHMRDINRELQVLRDLKVEILGISCQSANAISAFLKREKMDFQILADQERTVAKTYGVYTYLSWDSINIARPSFFFIDESGIIRYRHIGEHQWDLPNMTDLKKLAI